MAKLTTKYDLSIAIGATTAGLKKGLQLGIKGVNKFSRSVEKANKKMGKSFGALKGSIGSIVSGGAGSLEGAGQALGQLVAGAGPVGVAIGAAFAAAGAALATFFTRSAEGQEEWTKLWAKGQAIIDVLLDRVSHLGKAIFKLFSGDIKGAAEAAEAAVTGIGEAMQDNLKRAEQIAALENKLNRQRINNTVEFKKQELAISELILKSKQKEKFSEAERLGFVRKAQELQTKLSKQQISFKEQELKLLDLQQAQGMNNLDDDQQRADLVVEIISLRKQENDKTRELTNRENEAINALNIRLRAQKQAAEQAAAAEQARIQGLKKIESEAAKLDIEDQGFAINIDDLDLASIPTLTEQINAYADAQTAAFGEQATADIVEGINAQNEALYAQEQEMNRLKMAGMAMGNALGNMLGKGEDDWKAYTAVVLESIFNIIQAEIAAILTKALVAAFGTAATTPFGLFVIPAFVGLALGAAKAAISSIPSFADGGMAYGETLAMVGDYPGARNNPEVIAPLRDLQNMGMGAGQNVRFEITDYNLLGILSQNSKKETLF